jgi:hypothetical protein
VGPVSGLMPDGSGLSCDAVPPAVAPAGVFRTAGVMCTADGAAGPQAGVVIPKLGDALLAVGFTGALPLPCVMPLGRIIAMSIFTMGGAGPGAGPVATASGGEGGRTRRGGAVGGGGEGTGVGGALEGACTSATGTTCTAAAGGRGIGSTDCRFADAPARLLGEPGVETSGTVVSGGGALLAAMRVVQD